MKKKVIAIAMLLLLLQNVPLMAQSGPPADYNASAFGLRVAAKCKGEARFAIAECATTVYNRLQYAWTEENVLDPYFATSIMPTRSEAWIVDSILVAPQSPDERLFFMLSYSDLQNLCLDPNDALVTKTNGVLSVYFYDYPVWSATC